MLYKLKLLLPFLGVLLSIQVTLAQQYTLDEIISQARNNSNASKIAESLRENKSFQYKSYLADLKPQLSLTGNLLDYTKDFLSVIQPDGSRIFQAIRQNNSSAELSFSQQIGPTGGTFSINSSLIRFDDFEQKYKEYSGIPVRLSLSQPLFASNTYKWLHKIEPLKYQESEKEYLSEMNKITLSTVKLYFEIIEANINLELAKKNIINQEAILAVETKRIDLGTTTKDKLIQIQLQLLSSRQSIHQAETDIETALFNLKSYTNIKDDTLILIIPEKLPKLTIKVEEAIKKAKDNRQEYVSYLRRKLEAERDLDLAKKSRFSVNFNASIGLNGAATTLPAVYTYATQQQEFALGVTIPILDWGRTKEKINVATANLKMTNYTVEQEALSLEQEIVLLVKNLYLIERNIDIAKEADNLSQQRYVLALEQYRLGKTSLTEQNIALTEKDNAKRSYIKTIRFFWESYFQLKALTLADII